MSGPDFDELVGANLPAAERERLLAVHAALLEAGAPPELPPSLARPPRVSRTARVIPFPHRRRFAAGLVAVAAAAAVFAIGFAVGNTSSPGDPFRRALGPVPMHGTAVARGAFASIVVGPKDAAGNWPMVMHVTGLPAGAEYQLFLSRKGKPIESCTTFRVHAGRTDVWFNAPYDLRKFDGWLVLGESDGAVQAPAVFLTT